MKRSVGLWGGSILAAFVMAAAAQQAPDAGRVLQEVLKDRAPEHARPAPVMELQKDRPEQQALSTQPLRVEGFRFSGNTVLSAAGLAGIMAPYAGKEVSLADISRGVEEITRAYHARGYLFARAYIPEQQVVDNVVEIAIVEGRYGQVRLRRPDGDSRMRSWPLEGMLARLTPGDLVRLSDLERVVLLINDLPGVDAKAIVARGSQAGTVDLTVDLKYTRRVTGSVELDNYGALNLGEYRLGAGVEILSPLGIGDRISLRGLMSHAGGLQFGRGSYSMPVSYYGTKAGFAISRLRYSLSGIPGVVQGEGNATVGSVFLTHPLLRSSTTNFFVQTNYDAKQLNDFQNGIVTQEKQSQVATLGLSADHNDALFGGGLTLGSVAYSRGQLTIDVPANVPSTTAGSFNKTLFSLSRLQSLGKSFSLYAAGSGQVASKNLDSSEKFVLGGANGVRAYPQGEGIGDEGYLGTLEGRWAPEFGKNVFGFTRSNLYFSVFADYGRVQLERDLTIAGTSNYSSLSGKGLGFSWGRDNDWLVKAAAAWRGTGQLLSETRDARPRVFFQVAKSM